MWRGSMVRNTWRGFETDLHEHVRVLLQLQQLLIQREAWYPPYGPWEHIPTHVWAAHAHEDNDGEDLVGDDGDVCALCCTKSDRNNVCDKCYLTPPLYSPHQCRDGSLARAGGGGIPPENCTIVSQCKSASAPCKNFLWRLVSSMLSGPRDPPPPGGGGYKGGMK